jgi:uncharacterized membrane protein
MKNSTKLLATAIAAAAFSVTSAYAEVATEKCKVVDAEGKGLIKEHKGDCSTAAHSCAGKNAAGDPEAWINVPKGDCAKINAGDHAGIADEIKAKLEVPAK